MSAPSPQERLIARDRLEGAFRDAVGRVIARIEIYDEAETAASRALCLDELLGRCRDLKAAFEAIERSFQPHTENKS